MTASAPFEIHEAPRPGWVLLVVTGELDISTALTFRRWVRALKAANTHVSIDLSLVEFIDSSGARALEDVLDDSRDGSWRAEVAPNVSRQAARWLDHITLARGFGES